jgi:hypothetical protein
MRYGQKRQLNKENREGHHTELCITEDNLRMYSIILTMLGGVPVPTAWRVLVLQMEERPPAIGVSCEYIE